MWSLKPLDIKQFSCSTNWVECGTVGGLNDLDWRGSFAVPSGVWHTLYSNMVIRTMRLGNVLCRTLWLMSKYFGVHCLWELSLTIRPGRGQR